MNPMLMNPTMDKTQNTIINYKIAKCKNWEKDKTCKYGGKCTFAHGDEELRNKADNISNMTQPYQMFMPLFLEQGGMPIMMQPNPGFDFNQMQMMGNIDQNPLMMGMMANNSNIPPIINNQVQDPNQGGENKTQQ